MRLWSCRRFWRAPVSAPAPQVAAPPIVHSTFEDAIAAQAVANATGQAGAPANGSVPSAAAPLAPAALEEQGAALSIVPNLPEHSGAGGSEHLAANDPIARLMELAKLRASGMLTESEFNQLKASIIASTVRDSVVPSEPPRTAV